MTASSLPQDVHDFLVEYVDSVGQLELLLHARKDPSREWTAESFSHALHLDRAWVAGELGRLRAFGFFSPGQAPATWSFTPPPSMLPLLDAVAEAYAQRRVTVIDVIFSKPTERVRVFADAFRIRRDKP